MPTISHRSLLLVMLLLLTLVGPTVAAPSSADLTLSPEQLTELLNVKHGPLAPVGAQLAALSTEYQAYVSNVARGTTTQATFVSSDPLINTSGNYVIIDAVADTDLARLRADLERLGARDLAAANFMVSGLLPIAAIPDLAALESLSSARPAFATTNAGRITSQGDKALRADLARSSFGVDGSGITIGTISDSYNCLGGAPAGVTSDDLPQGVVVLKEYNQAGCSDEGRAMIEIIHDLAPSATQKFRTAFISQPDFAQGIRDLAAAGANIIVDDIGYFAEPMFQDGIVAQAVDDVVADGVTYFSAAGNMGRLSYESAFRPSSQFLVGSEPYIPHDFDPGPGVDTFQSLTIPAGSSITGVLQWDEAFKSVSGGLGATADLDVLVFDEQNSSLISTGASNSLGADALEIFSITNSTAVNRVVNLFIGNYAGSGILLNPGYLKVVYFDDLTSNEFDTKSSTLYGHSNALGTIAVGAADYLDTPEFSTSPPLLRDYSSGGGTPIFFDSNGTRKPTTENRAKPAITATDGANTTFFFPGADREGDGFPNFSGTSAAAPHAAAVAALLLEADLTLTPPQIRSILQETAIDMGTAGFDADSGAGLIQADAALASLDGGGSADLQLSLRSEPYVAPSRPLTYTLSLRNAGPDAARGVVVTHTLPLSVSFVSASASGGNCIQSVGKVVCTISTLAPAANITASIRVNTSAGATGTLNSTALTTTSNNDPASSNNSAIASTRVVPLSSSADLRLSAIANASSLPLSQPLTYTISISNQGPAASIDVTATVKLATSVTFRTASGSGWSCSRNGVTVTCTRPSLVNGASAPITVGVTTSATIVGEVLKETTLTATTPDLNSIVDRVTVLVRVGRTLFLPLTRK